MNDIQGQSAVQLIYDVVIIGGGPAGLAAGQYASRSKLKTIIIDKSKTAGKVLGQSHRRS